MTKVSVIVPVYNGEKTIMSCIKSIIDQTYSNLEILIINDGSSDNTEGICNKLANLDDRIIIFNKPNSGPSDTRNFGIKKVTGDYIQFVDADDSIEKDMVEKLVGYMIGNDLVICGANIERSNMGTNKKKIPLNIGTFDISGFMSKFGVLLRENFINPPWNKMFKRDIILKNNILFDSDFKMGEDLLFNLDYINHCNKITVINECLYNYKVSGDFSSLSTKFDEKYFENQLNLYRRLKIFVNQNERISVGINSIYVEEFFLSGVIGSINNLFHKNSNYNIPMRILKIKRIVSHIMVQENLRTNRYKSLKKNVLKFLINNKLVFIIYFLFLIKQKTYK